MWLIHPRHITGFKSCAQEQQPLSKKADKVRFICSKHNNGDEDKNRHLLNSKRIRNIVTQNMMIRESGLIELFVHRSRLSEKLRSLARNKILKLESTKK